MFVCSNEKVENHSRTINCDDSKMTVQKFLQFFFSVCLLFVDGKCVVEKPKQTPQEFSLADKNRKNLASSA